MRPEREVIYCLSLSHNNNTMYRHVQTHVDGTGAVYFSLSLPLLLVSHPPVTRTGLVISPSSSSSKVSLVSSRTEGELRAALTEVERLSTEWAEVERLSSEGAGVVRLCSEGAGVVCLSSKG